MQKSILEEALRKILEKINLNDGQKLIELVEGVVIKDSHVGFSITINENNIEEIKIFQPFIEKSILNIDGISKATIVYTNYEGKKIDHTAFSRNSNNQNNNLDNSEKSTNNFNKDNQEFRSLKNVKVIAVSSCKGGVGKSTISANLALNLSKAGKKVAIADLDIYGPSIPSIFKIQKDIKPEISNNYFIPIEKYGIKIMSIGFLVKSGLALAMRGPMITKTSQQILHSTNWGDLEYLIIDTPPGTGDVHISILEKNNLDGVVFVTIPGELSMNDVLRGIDLYKKFDISLLGIIENMSYLETKDGNINIFGSNDKKYREDKANKEDINEKEENIVNKLKILSQIPIKPNIIEQFPEIVIKELKIDFLDQIKK